MQNTSCLPSNQFCCTHGMPGPRLPSLSQVAGPDILSLDFAALTTSPVHPDFHDWTSPTIAVFTTLQPQEKSDKQPVPVLPEPYLTESSSERWQRIMKARHQRKQEDGLSEHASSFRTISQPASLAHQACCIWLIRATSDSD